MVKNALEHLKAAIAEIEERVASGHLSKADAEMAIADMRETHERLNRLERKLDGRPIQPE